MNARGSDHYVKVLFDLEQDEDGYPPAAAETLWAVRVGDRLFQIDNIPFFVRGIAVNDIVSATPEEGVFRYKEVVQPSGHGTIRLIVSEMSDVQAGAKSPPPLDCRRRSPFRAVAGTEEGAGRRPGTGPLGLRGSLSASGLIQGASRRHMSPDSAASSDRFRMKFQAAGSIAATSTFYFAVTGG